MPHDITLISTIAVGFALAFLFGFLAQRLGASPLVGYLVAGVAIGPFTPCCRRRGSICSWPVRCCRLR